MQNHIIIEPASKIREIARNALAGYWKPVVIGVLFYFLLTSGVESVLNSLFAFTYPVELYGQNFVETVPYGGNIYNLILGGPLELGFAFFGDVQALALEHEHEFEIDVGMEAVLVIS